MVVLVPNKPYTLHARSIDRVSGTENDYKLNLRDPIQCPDDHHIKATFVSCTMPSTMYQINSKNNTFTLLFNQNRPGSYFNEFASLALEDVSDNNDTKQDGTLINDLTDNRTAYARTVLVTISEGNYNIEELMAEVVAKANAACTAAHVAPLEFRTFLRAKSGVLRTEDIADSQDVTDNAGVHLFIKTNDYVKIAPDLIDWNLQYGIPLHDTLAGIRREDLYEYFQAWFTTCYGKPC